MSCNMCDGNSVRACCMVSCMVMGWWCWRRGDVYMYVCICVCVCVACVCVCVCVCLLFVCCMCVCVCVE